MAGVTTGVEQDDLVMPVRTRIVSSQHAPLAWFASQAVLNIVANTARVSTVKRL